jgi:prolyl-tRNA synthetase
MPNLEEKPNAITVKKSENFSEWYSQVLIKSGFVDYTAVSGALAFRPDAYFVWETLQRATDALFKKEGIQNVYFPLLIPERLLNKEKEHVEGFSPEVAWVTHAGNTKLDERLAIRPTSETIMYESYSKWIRSWRDLPMRYNQWNNVIRWEFKHPTPILRSREFLWNEGHTVFATKEEADAERDVILGIESKVLKEYLALPGVVGRKTDSEKFAGAEATYSIEHLTPEGLSVQGPDFHNDGQRFAKAFNITFVDKDSKSKYAYQNTFAMTTREIGVMVAVHGDDKGLIIPPMVARIQVVIVPIYKDEGKEGVMKYCELAQQELGSKIRSFVDVRESYTPGWKFNEWEMRGIPVRVEAGVRDISAEKVVVVRRDTGEKTAVDLKKLGPFVSKLLDEIQDSLYEKAKRQLEDNIHQIKDFEELKVLIKGKGGFAQGGWCGSVECEKKVKETTARISGIPFGIQNKVKGLKCVVCGKPAKFIVNIAKSY